ncbi:MAG: UPF0721 transmembrane protein [marine bacterium B5-7]|nr:MAG: UPF0721 transmembrane protein [marine bacterium B5-7]
MNAWIFLGAVPLATLSGFVRGVTGFGGAMVFTAPMALLVEPKIAVMIALVLEAFAALNMLPEALKKCSSRVIAPLCLAACLTIPFGTYLLTELDSGVLKRFIAGTVLVLAIFMLRGFRYTGRQRITTSAILGGVSGLLVSATSVGAPPVILYLLSGPDSVATTRANLTLYIIAISMIALMVLLLRGAFNPASGLIAILLAPCYFSGVWFGSRVFPRVDDKSFRRFVLWFLIVLSTILLMT